MRWDEWALILGWCGFGKLGFRPSLVSKGPKKGLLKLLSERRLPTLLKVPPKKAYYCTKEEIRPIPYNDLKLWDPFVLLFRFYRSTRFFFLFLVVKPIFFGILGHFIKILYYSYFLSRKVYGQNFIP